MTQNKKEQWLKKFDEKFDYSFAIEDYKNGTIGKMLKDFLSTAIDQNRQETIEECNKIIAEMKLEKDYFYAKRNIQETLSDVIERLERLK